MVIPSLFNYNVFISLTNISCNLSVRNVTFAFFSSSHRVRRFQILPYFINVLNNSRMSKTYTMSGLHIIIHIDNDIRTYVARCLRYCKVMIYCLIIFF